MRKLAAITVAVFVGLVGALALADTRIFSVDQLEVTTINSTGQVKTTLNPANTTNTSASILANPTACATDELLVGALVNGTTKSSIDCEGDVVGVKGTYSGVLTSSSQVTSTVNPADTTFANGAVIANPAACGTDEILVGGGVAGTAKGTIDCEGDVVGVKGTYSGVLTSTSQVTTTLNPADTTFAAGAMIANPAACGTDEVLVGAGVAGTAKATLDCEGDVAGVKGTYSGVLTSSSQVTTTLDPADTTFANGSLIANPATCAANEILLGAGVAGTAKATMDCEGDIVGVKGDFTGVVTFGGNNTYQANDITAADITNITRSVPLPLHAWVPCADGVWDSSGADAEPDLVATPANALAIVYDDTGGTVDTGTICTSFTVPADYASGGTFVARVTQDGATVTQQETWSCAISVDGAAVGAANAANLTNQTAVQSATSTPTGTWAAGASIQVACSQGNASADDTVNLHSIEGQYTATQ